MNKILPFFFLVFPVFSLQSQNEFGKLLGQEGQWSLYENNQHTVLVSRGKTTYVYTDRGRHQLLLSQFLNPIYFGLRIDNSGKKEYFFWVTRSFASEFLQSKVFADGLQFEQTNDGRINESSLLEQLKRVAPSFTAFHFEPVADPDESRQFDKILKIESPEDYNKWLQKRFFPTILLKWHRHNEIITLLKIYEVNTESNELEEIEDLFDWLQQGLSINESEDKEKAKPLYMSSTLDIFRERPTFTLDFDFKSLKAAVELLDRHQKK